MSMGWSSRILYLAHQARRITPEIMQQALVKLAADMDRNSHRAIPLLRTAAQDAAVKAKDLRSVGDVQRAESASTYAAAMQTLVESLTGVGQTEWENRADLIRFTVQAAVFHASESARRGMESGCVNEFSVTVDANVFWQAVDIQLHAVMDLLAKVALSQRVSIVKQAMRESLMVSEKKAAKAFSEHWAGEWLVMEPTILWGYLDKVLPIVTLAKLYGIPKEQDGEPDIDLRNGSVKVWAVLTDDEDTSFWGHHADSVAQFTSERLSPPIEGLAPVLSAVTADRLNAMRAGERLEVGTGAIMCCLAAHNWVQTLPVQQRECEWAEA